MLNIFFLLPLLIASPELNISWTDDSKKILEIKIMGEDKYADSCLNSGLEVQYRYEAKLCKKQNTWFDDCSNELTQTHFLNFDPISQSYNFIVDRHRDGNDPQEQVVSDRIKALNQLRNLKALELSFFDNYEQAENEVYLKTRAFSRCQGEYSKAWSDITYYLSLGLIRLEGFNTGWQDYDF